MGMKHALQLACVVAMSCLSAQASATRFVFLNFDQFYFYPNVTVQHFVDGLDGFDASAFGAAVIGDVVANDIQALMLQFMREDFADFDVELVTTRPEPPTPFVRWGMDDRSYTFASPCDDVDGVDSDGDGELECVIPDNRRLYGIACADEPDSTCEAINVARTFAGSFTLTPFDQPYNGGTEGSVSDPPLLLSTVGSIEPIARALANNASHEIAHLFGARHPPTNDQVLDLMSTQREGLMAMADKQFVGDGLLRLCEVLGPSGPDSRCPTGTGNAAEMDTGSPTVLSQMIAPDFEFSEVRGEPLAFDYLFRTTTGVLKVYVGGQLLSTINAPASLAADFTHFAYFIPASVFQGQPRELRLVIDETDPAQQSRIVLRRVRSSGIENGYFQSGDLSKWTVEAQGNGGVRVIDSDELDTPPTAVASANSPVGEGALVTLDGSASFDPQGDSLNYSWRQIAGSPLVSLAGAASATATFDAPATTGNSTLTFELVVDDGIDRSAPVTVDVTIQDVNSPPVADAGDDFSIKAGALASLDGSNSFDPDGTPLGELEFEWTQVSGPGVALDPADPIHPTFAVPLDIGATIRFTLTLGDGFEQSVPSAGTDSSVPDTVAVGIVDNAAPDTNAGPDQTRNEGAQVTLSASASSDPDGDALVFSWHQLSGPEVGISGSSAITPVFYAPTAPAGGLDLEFELTATDDDVYAPKSATDRVIVHVANINDPPSCELAYPSVATLWPPDHKLAEVSIGGVMDTDDLYNDVLLTIESVLQDEPQNGTGDGDSSPDAVIRDAEPADSVMLRAERAGDGNGRVYRVEFSATDGFESCTGSVSVTVPPSRKAEADDDGAAFGSQ